MKRIIVFLGLVFLGFGGKVEAVKIITPTVTIEPAPTVAVEGIKGKPLRSNWYFVNSLRVAIEGAIEKGVDEETIVLLLLLPLVATLVSVLHYIVGLAGYGIFMPTMIAVTFLATGIFGGLLLFGMILIISLLSNIMLRKMRLHFWPARSINLMFICIGTFGLMVLTSYFRFIDLSRMTIFPVLFMILLAEEFVRTQLNKSKDEAVKLTLGTLVLAGMGAVVMSVNEIRILVLRYPEVIVLLVLVINIFVGNYGGIRLLEINRFKKAIRKKK